MYLFYGILPEGNLLVLYLFAAVYLVALLGLGLLISTLADTQLQAMFIAFFLTSSLRHPKIFIKEFGDFLMPCHQHCLSVYILVQR
jgi:ABC-type multidrug transport system permease subunit